MYNIYLPITLEILFFNDCKKVVFCCFANSIKVRRQRLETLLFKSKSDNDDNQF